jgi:hypothetical protein
MKPSRGEARGISNIDIPVLVLGVAADWQKVRPLKLPEQIVENRLL